MIEQPKRAAGYVRVSQVGGREGDSFLSPDVQRDKIDTWASYRGYTMVAWYTDLDRPAKERDVRPEFERMMADAKQGRFEAVAVYRLTRFARSVSQAASRFSELQAAGVDLVSVTEDFDTSTSSGRLVQNMLFALAEFESQRIGEEWRNVHAARRRRGIAHVARPMTGYVTEGAVIANVDPAEAKMVREMFTLRLHGRNLGEIQDWIESHGHRPKRGGDRFAKTTIRQMLQNPLYAGLVRLPNGDLIDASHEAIVARDVWEAVQTTWPRTTALSRVTRPGLLSGLLVCSGCGYRMRFEGIRGRYRCKWRDLSRNCDHPVTIKATLAEEHVERAFLRRFDPQRMPNRGRLKASRQQERWQRKLGGLRGRAAELNQALDTLADQRFVKGSASGDEYDRQVSRFLAERQLVQGEAARLEEALGSSRAVNVEALELWPALSVPRKRQALSVLVHEIVVKPAHGRLQPASQRLDIGWLQ